MSAVDSNITCLFSHKCCEEAHRVGLLIQKTLLYHNISLQIDPFDVGDNVAVRIQTFGIEALLFLLSPESISSPWVKLELKSARRQRLPVFTLHLQGTIPTNLKTSSIWSLPPIWSVEFLNGVDKLAVAVRRRVDFRNQLRRLYPSSSVYDLIEVAQSLALNAERTLLAESACELAMKYCRIPDPSTRYWIAMALGRADTNRAARLLRRLPDGDHHLELEGLRQAGEMLRHNAPQ